ncbi:uncharacterized protein C6orf47 homolog [Sphaerodactylus townsendi]|uniref:Uncharacterized protein n=1 Tax=Sphaerodactylus townsendi TaxID=933632 RepID=A0ACB8EGN6_9SAUR|nr:uncharacterized protein C6orf47 homolog [Sphaerodactylus townsendi]
MFFSKVRSWLPALPSLRGKAKQAEGPGALSESPAPPKARWWTGHWIWGAIRWSRSSAPIGEHSLLAGIPQHLSPRYTQPTELPEHFQICFNFARHLFDLCVVTLLCASSPVFRLALDILGFGGPLKVWLHGVACFLVTAYGMYLALWLVQEYLVQFACLYGFLQTLVLCVSMRAGDYEDQEADPGTAPDAAKEDQQSDVELHKQ